MAGEHGDGVPLVVEVGMGLGARIGVPFGRDPAGIRGSLTDQAEAKTPG
jgi:hypothetical protein